MLLRPHPDDAEEPAPEPVKTAAEQALERRQQRKNSVARGRLLRATEQAFQVWLAEGDNAAVLDLRPIKNPDYRCTYHFAGIYPGIQLWILPSAYDVSVQDEDDEECWDWFISDDCAVEQRDDGSFYCRLAEEPNEESFPTRDAVWRKHLFEHLRKWVEQTSRRSHTLVLAEDEGFTEALLEPPEGGRGSWSMCKVIPLRITDGAEESGT